MYMYIYIYTYININSYPKGSTDEITQHLCDSVVSCAGRLGAAAAMRPRTSRAALAWEGVVGPPLKRGVRSPKKRDSLGTELVILSIEIVILHDFTVLQWFCPKLNDG